MRELLCSSHISLQPMMLPVTQDSLFTPFLVLKVTYQLFWKPGTWEELTTKIKFSSIGILII